MKNLKSLGFAALLIAVIGLSGCDTGSSATTITSVPQNPVASEEPIASENPETSESNVSTEEDATPETNTTSETNETPDANETSEDNAVPENDKAPEDQEQSAYTTFTIEEAAHAMTNNGRDLIYGTIDGLLYSLNPDTGVSTFLYDVNPFNDDLLIGGLSYIGDNQFFYSPVRDNTVNRLNIATDEAEVIADIKFADGLDVYHNKIYTVTYNKSGMLTVLDMDGAKLYTLETDIDDMVGVAHSDRYLYILSESGNIYQVDSETGRSQLIIENEDLFETGESFGGVEAIDVLNNHIYLSNVNDSTVYRINQDVRTFE